MTYCLYSVAIGIQKKGGEIVRVVFSVHAGRSDISAARVKRRCLESEHRTSVRSTETQVHPCDGSTPGLTVIVNSTPSGPGIEP